MCPGLGPWPWALAFALAMVIDTCPRPWPGPLTMVIDTCPCLSLGHGPWALCPWPWSLGPGLGPWLGPLAMVPDHITGTNTMALVMTTTVSFASAMALLSRVLALALAND